MKGTDVIAYQVEDDNQLQSILITALRLSILESAFGFSGNSIPQSIHSNFERNVALGLFRHYSNNLNVNFSWKSKSDFHCNLFDFKWNESRYLLMNKMVRKPVLSSSDYIFLPALIPNRFERDRWFSSQLDLEGNAISFVFTFLLSESNSSANGKEYFQHLSSELESFLSILKRRFNGYSSDSPPFTEDWFWSEVSRRGGIPQLYAEFKPTLIITGVCNPDQYKFFSDTDGLSEFAYALYTGKWYEVESPGVLNFRQGVVKSSFKNATCPLAALSSFNEMFGA